MAILCTTLIHGEAGMHHMCALYAVMQHFPLPSRPVLDCGSNSVPHSLIAMLDPKFLEEISNRISTALAATPAADIEKNMRAMLTAQLGKLDLVTRADFEIQKELLARAQARLAQLEAKISALEELRKP